ncbi:MAG: hypothetical protein HYW23_02740 [Candidatus Aenigmarchaeota archaeon]|nr:hypothetical protein [Candidatus Aenigmarchaeota archaeon]
MGFDTSRYTSNEWLAPIGEKAKEVFRHYPRAVAIESASAVLYQYDSGRVEVPWTTVFPSDDISRVYERLLTTLRTPDHQTPAFDPQLREPIKQLIKILSEADAEDGAIACHASYYLVQVAAGKLEENFRTYQDLARRYPQYSNEWINTLLEQFGYDRVLKAAVQHLELFNLLHKNETLGLQCGQPRLQQDGESTPDFIRRAIQALNITDMDSLVTTTKMVDRRNIPYRTAAYNLRGLPITA